MKLLSILTLLQVVVLAQSISMDNIDTTFQLKAGSCGSPDYVPYERDDVEKLVHINDL